ncbi:cupin domain-containing protein [Haloprofundus halophilus]|uniref:cupin domain-containing protein n=1 Tax=Haloprofundus halophilus TaxID=2283527 RepID=UPI000E431F5B|nr:cupin domain-containing protein [Haloprofundus halophilus]
MEPVNEADIDWTETERDDTHFRRKKLASAAGGDRLGCSLYELPPGGNSWPYHFHTGNEEAIYVLSGRGTLRLDGDEYDLREGDYVALPAGEESAHRVGSDGGGTLRYLMLSTMDDPDVSVYPDSGKVGIFAGSAPGSDAPRVVEGYYRRDDTVGYWEG